MVTSSQSQQADELRKSGKYLEAIPLYQEQVRTSTSTYPLRWLIYCQRKSDQLEAAYSTAKEALKKFSNDNYIRSECAWVIYDRELKPNKEAGNFGGVVQAAQKALGFDPENVFLKNKVAQAVIKTGKKSNNPDWATIAHFVELIDTDTLSDKKRQTNDGKQYMSEKEDWFVNASHTFLKLENYPKAIEIANNGLIKFPNEIFLIRTIALAQFRSGDEKAAELTMKPLLTHPRCDWYIRSELAEIEIKLGNFEEAYRLLCQALLTHQEEKFKVKNLELFASLAMETNKLEQAQLALALDRAVRTGAGWNVPSALIDLEDKCHQAFGTAKKEIPEIPEAQADIARKCVQIWKDGALEGLERFKGKIAGIRDDRKYAFIRSEEDGNSVIVFLRDLPRECAFDGTLVEYSREKSFDVKKNKDSFKAIQIRKITQ